MLLLDFINVGYGDAILVRDTEEPFSMLVDCGDTSVGDAGPGSKRISAANFIQREGIRTLNLLVLTHLHRDHSGGLTELLKKTRVEEVWVNYLPPKEFWGGRIDPPSSLSTGPFCLIQSLNIYLSALDNLQTNGAQIILMAKDLSRRALTNKLDIELCTSEESLQIRQNDIWTQALAGHVDDTSLLELDGFINNTSLRLRLHFGDRQVELPGDVYAEYWESQSPKSCDILKLPHHGHEDSVTEYLVNILHPDYTVISVSNTRNDNCPNPNVVQMMRQKGSQVYFTDAVHETGRTTSAHTALRFEITSGCDLNVQEIS